VWFRKYPEQLRPGMVTGNSKGEGILKAREESTNAGISRGMGRREVRPKNAPWEEHGFFQNNTSKWIPTQYTIFNTNVPISLT